MHYPTGPALGSGVSATPVLRVIRVLGMLAFAVWVWSHIHDPFGLLHGSLLIFHEAGHVLFMPFGEFMMVLGGSLFQIIVPTFFVGMFALRRDWFGTCFATLYLAASFADVGVYIADARAGALPLLGGDRSNHDWTFLLIEMNLLHRDTLIGAYMKDIAIMLFWPCTIAGVWIGWRGVMLPRSEVPARAADARSA